LRRFGTPEATLNGPALKLPLLQVALEVMPNNCPGTMSAAGKPESVRDVDVPAVMVDAPML
jgi:hypothetical protein